MVLVCLRNAIAILGDGRLVNGIAVVKEIQPKCGGEVTQKSFGSNWSL